MQKTQPLELGLNNVAATYSPGCNPSTIGAAGLNFSVRDGKRWDPCARPPKSLYLAVSNIFKFFGLTLIGVIPLTYLVETVTNHR